MVTNSKLKQATATCGMARKEKSFYAGDKIIKTGDIEDKAEESVTLNASTTSKTFDTSGKYCTGDMTVSTSTKGAESVTITPSGSAQSYTFATSGKLCTGNMTVSVGAIPASTLTIRIGAFIGTDGQGAFSASRVFAGVNTGTAGSTNTDPYNGEVWISSIYDRTLNNGAYTEDHYRTINCVNKTVG